MKKLFKVYKTNFQLIIAFSIVLSLSLTSCSKDTEDSNVIKGTVTADAEGKVLFMYSRSSNTFPGNCLFTTDLPAPNNQFTLTIATGEASAQKEIDGLNAGQKVSWSSTVEGNPLNHGSGNFVHIIND
ncbi:MAG: hypothetical protein LBE56_13580 [Tannerella sp.]|jgi:hypothetical protein|nr:hypothetical protein [Tannerella sp.]